MIADDKIMRILSSIVVLIPAAVYAKIRKKARGVIVMYKITDGILQKDGKKVLAIGESYYPSFHQAKYPVPPEGDRMAEMKKDFRLMKEMGINHIRIASIGICKKDENGKTVLDTPFVDAMLEEAEQLDISISVRIEGYAVNLRDFKNVLMIDENGDEQDTSKWFDFIQTTLNHEGLLEDNVEYSEVKAKYYDKFDSVVGYQVYNEPHYPGDKFFDYHPENIKAYRAWLVEKNIMSKEDAAVYEVPRKRGDDTPTMWAYWRLFNRDSLTNFLNTGAYGVKKVSDKPTFTCYTTDALSYMAPYRCVDPFGNARYMDIVGYTMYCHSTGSEYYTAALAMENFVHAAECAGKKCWCIEVDSRTTIPPSLFNKNTYTALGSGATGLVYYQWRGDYPSEATPIPNGCGLVNYDGSHTPNYDNAKQTFALLNEISDYVVEAAPANEKVGIFYSDYALYYCDANQNGNKTRADLLYNDYIEQINEIYKQLRVLGYTVKTVDETALKQNAFDLDVLFVPTKYALSDSEQQTIAVFKAGGKTVLEAYKHGMRNAGFGFVEYGVITNRTVASRSYKSVAQNAENVMLERGIRPIVKSSSTLVAAQTLIGPDYKLFCLTNLTHPTVTLDTVLECNFTPISATLFESGKPKRALKTENNKIYVDGLNDGGVIVVK